MLSVFKRFFQGLNCLSFLGTIFPPNSPVLHDHPLKDDFFFSFCQLLKRKTPTTVRELLCLTFRITVFSIYFLLLKTMLNFERDYLFKVYNSSLLSAALVYYYLLSIVKAITCCFLLQNKVTTKSGTLWASWIKHKLISPPKPRLWNHSLPRFNL